MYTRCPACQTVHPVNADMLARDGGRYRCTKCNTTANALEALSLFDEWPDADQEPPAAGDTPVLGMTIDPEQAAGSRKDPDGPDSTDEASDSGRTEKVRWTRVAWVAAAAALVAIVLYQLAEYQGRPLLDPVLEATGLKDEPPPRPYRDLSQIHLVDRELLGSSDQPGMLRLNATIVNRANRRQPFPTLEITLLDKAGRSLASKRFRPGEYLADSSRRTLGMTPHAFLPLSVEIEDPGSAAVGFELQFH